MIPQSISPLISHLWQSTLFAAIAGLLAFSLRKHQAPARHWLWLAASLKFLIPFSLLAAAGSYLGWGGARQVALHRVSIVVEAAGQGFVPLDILGALHRDASAAPASGFQLSLALAVWFCGFAAVILNWYFRWRRINAAVRAASPIREGREFEAMLRVGGLHNPVPLFSSSSSLEPGIFGILRPVLLLPAGIGERLADAQLDAILAHELCHVRRRDNLAGAVHMAVEAIFWFHPLVWWLGARLLDERERACDEQVLQLGCEPQVYAESILKICEFYLESPLVCAAGVTGADLKKRIEEIMSHRIAYKLNLARKVLLAAFGMAAVVGPVGFGLLHPSESRAQPPAGSAAKEFEVASIKPSAAENDHRVRVQIMPGGRYTASNVTVKMLMQQAYNIKDFQISGGPGWMSSERYDLVAKADGDVGGAEQIRPLIQKLLKDRFQLTFHRDTKELPVYSLVVGKNGLKMSESSAPPQGRMMRFGRGEISGQAMSMEVFATQLSGPLGRTVIDKTGLKGAYDVKLSWTPEDAQPRPGEGPEAAPPPDTTGPSLFTALQEQLGLKLESSRGPVEIFVIERLEKPSEN